MFREREFDGMGLEGGIFLHVQVLEEVEYLASGAGALPEVQGSCPEDEDSQGEVRLVLIPYGEPYTHRI
jgi:hypothetical protein